MKYLFLFLAVFAGCVLAFLLKKKEERQMGIYLAFSGAFLLAITVFELLPEVFEEGTKVIGLYILGGILLQIVLDFFSKGAEHGHVHLPTERRDFPWLLLVSLSIHAVMEGFPISEENNIMLGVIIHKIPVAAILTLFFIRAEYSKVSTFLFLFIFALMTPMGSWFSGTFDIFQEYHLEIMAVVIGIFLHVSTTILFESSKDHRFNLAKLISIVLGMILAYFL